MKNQFMRAEEVARELEVSRSYAYRLIRQLNAELHEKGYMTIAGRVNRQYLTERLYGTCFRGSHTHRQTAHPQPHHILRYKPGRSAEIQGCKEIRQGSGADQRCAV